MDAGLVLKIYLIVVGIILVAGSIRSLVKKEMIEHYCHVWALLAIVLVVLGCVIEPSALEQYISLKATIMILIGITGIIYIVWELITSISILTRQNRELAMQIVLLNQENVKKQEENYEEESSIRN